MPTPKPRRRSATCSLPRHLPRHGGEGLRPVLRPRSYRFETAEETAEDEIAQGVSLQDEAGIDWVALYTLQRQVDGQWRITGCQLKKAPGDAA